ncbi:MAG: hypothetical protein U1F43_09840 [Myxococcota bacterium]
MKDAEDPEQPMRWTLSLELPGWASVEGGVYTVAKPFATLAAPDLASAPGLSIMASLPARQTPLRVSPHSEKVVLRVTLPPGTSPSELPSDLDASYGPHHLTQRTTTAHVGKAEVVTIERHARFAPARIDPADYPAFRTFVDQAERTLSAPLRIR